MELNTAQRRHIVSAYATVTHFLTQMEEIARDGRSPTGVGPRTAPLPPELTQTILAPVRELQARLHGFAREHAPAELEAFERRLGVDGTLVWMSNLLERIRYVADDLRPTRVRRYGPVGADESEALGALHEALSGSLAQARAVLEKQGK